MSATDVRTQIYLPTKLHRDVKRAAARRGISMAQLLREAAEELLRRERAARRDPLADVIGAAGGEADRVSEAHDEYLYGLEESDR